MSDKSINLSISVDQTNLILEALGQLPFVKVYELIGSIQGQAKAQLEETGEAPLEPAAVPSLVENASGE